jgi:pimeloyl-ACP methyl ester carboxylesterase
MAPGVAGNVYAFDLRFEKENLIGRLDEVQPLENAVDGPIAILWDTASSLSNASPLLDGVAQVELPRGYRKQSHPNSVILKRSGEGYFWDHVLCGHASAIILVLPPGYGLSRDIAPPINFQGSGASRLSAKEHNRRVAILFTLEPDLAVNLRTTWYLMPLGTSVESEVRRINSLPEHRSQAPHMAVDPEGERPRYVRGPIPPSAQAPKRWYRRWQVWIGVAFLCFSALGILLALGIGAYRQKCPPVTVPTSHFVKKAETPQNRKVIVFVHGVTGDMDNTWANTETHTSWPEMIAKDPTLSAYDVYVYGYESPCEGNTSNITEIANRFRTQLLDDSFFSKYDEIDFITHSMGGLITKRMLSSLNTPADADKLQRVRSVLLIAVPSSGAPVAAIGDSLSTNPQFTNMDPVQSKAFLQAMDQDWDSMMRGRTPGRPYPRAFVAYETKDLAILKIVSSLFTSQVSDDTPMPFDYDHIAIVKPNSTDNDVYKWSRARILDSSSFAEKSGGEGSFGMTFAGNPLLWELVEKVAMAKHVAITFGNCSKEEIRRPVTVNGAQLWGENVPDFLETSVQPRMRLNFSVTTIVKDVSYRIDCGSNSQATGRTQ